MKHLVKSYIDGIRTANSPYFNLFSSSLIIFISSMLANFFNFLFNLATARNLSVENYGILQTMLNIFNMINILTVLVTIQLTKQLSKYLSKGKYSSASALTNKSNLFVITVGIIIFIFFIPISNILHISIGSVTPENLSFIILLFILSFPVTIHKAFMKANLLFMAFALNSVFQQIAKLIFSIPLLILGFKLQGVIWSLIISSMLAFIYSVWQLRGRMFLSLFEKINFNVKTFTKESASTMISFLGLTSLISIDLILAQHYLPQKAGYYAGLTLFGKGLILTTSPIGTVLFPLIINAKSNLDGKKLFKIAIFGVFALGLSILLIYMLIPKQIVGIALSPSYQAIVPLLSYYSLSILLYAVSYIVVTGFIAFDEFIPGYAALLAAMLQIAGISYFHRNLSDIVIVSLFTNILLIICLAVFTLLRLHTITKRYYDSKLLSIE